MHKTRLTTKNVRLWLEELSKDGNVSRCCRLLGISRAAVYLKRQKDPKFRAAWDSAIDRGIESLIDEAHRRAYRGVSEPVFHNGRLVGFKRRFSDVLAMFLIKAHRPEYRERPLLDVPVDSKFRLVMEISPPAEVSDKDVQLDHSAGPAAGENDVLKLLKGGNG